MQKYVIRRNKVMLKEIFETENGFYYVENNKKHLVGKRNLFDTEEDALKEIKERAEKREKQRRLEEERRRLQEIEDNKNKERILKILNEKFDNDYKKLREYIYEKAMEYESDIIRDINTEIKDIFENHPKYVWQHDGSPYDDSGETVKDENGFSIDDYKTVEDFLEEYNGGWGPTYESRRGKYHMTYSDDIEDMLSEKINKIIDDLFNKTFNLEDCYDIAGLIEDLDLCEHDFYGDFISDLHNDIFYGILNQDFKQVIGK